ncbi:MAG TPA: hypothetical protein VKU41_03165, partial [Polyangiaceae bacterium]|nr:hypothetical protein [Polyangiaceae bacterium]
AAVLAKVGHAAASLDDSYIHFQYARAIVEGHPLRFQAGEPVTSGATSLLWPALLAPFWALGARDDNIVWGAWALSYLALGGLAWEAGKLAWRLAGPAAAWGAGAMILSFGGLAWCAASGMEVVPFAWAVARATRRASEWSEGAADVRSGRRAAEVLALAWAAALLRPEGIVTALFVCATLVAFRGPHPRRERAYAVAAAAAVAAAPILLWATTGSLRSNTAVVKLLPGNPYYVGDALAARVGAQARQLVGDLLNGDMYSIEFLPHGGAPFAMAGLGAVALLATRTKSWWRGAGVLLIALTMFAPCFYDTFLWNRLRYLWPFAPGWIIGLACLARLAGDAWGVLRSSAPLGTAAPAPATRAGSLLTTALLCGGFAGLFVSRLEGVIDDVAESASEIDRQHVTLGRWARANLPPEARIGVNDTGAIAYFGGHKTFDVVGLTTRDEGRYWVAGAASRFEHYERLWASDRTRLPTHFIVYPEWLGLDAVLGDELSHATVPHGTILGGETMRAYVADWSKLGSGERPWSSSARIVDALDVADLESEAEHAYDLLGAHEREETVIDGSNPDGGDVVDGGRTLRTRERFEAHLVPGAPSRGIVRLKGSEGALVRVLAKGQPVAVLSFADDPDGAEDEPEADDWVERTFDIPASATAARTPIELVVEGGTVSTFHYWFVAQDVPPG